MTRIRKKTHVPAPSTVGIIIKLRFIMYFWMALVPVQNSKTWTINSHDEDNLDQYRNDFFISMVERDNN